LYQFRDRVALGEILAHERYERQFGDLDEVDGPPWNTATWEARGEQGLGGSRRLSGAGVGEDSSRPGVVAGPSSLPRNLGWRLRQRGVILGRGQ
jgi:hypothetical protein